MLHQAIGRPGNSGGMSLLLHTSLEKQLGRPNLSSDATRQEDAMGERMTRSSEFHHQAYLIKSCGTISTSSGTYRVL